MVMKKIKLTESDLYRIVRKVLLEQEEEKNNRRIFNKNPEYFKMILKNVFRNDSEKLTRVFNQQYDKVIINGGIQFIFGDIEFLPDNLTINGSFILYGCEQLIALPKNLNVIGNLDLSGTGIKFLPNDLNVSGDLRIGGTKIKNLPDGIKIGGSIIGKILKKSSELKEQEPTSGENPAYPAVTKWDSGVKRGPANPTNPKQKWSETYPIKRGKANTIDQKNKWSTDLTRGKANTLL
jgi:hypothetical protein